MLLGNDIQGADVSGLWLTPKSLGEPSIEMRGDLRVAMARFEKEFIQKVVEDHHNNMTNAARELGIERSLLYKKLKRLEGVLEEEGR